MEVSWGLENRARSIEDRDCNYSFTILEIALNRVGFIRDRKYIVRAVKSKIAHQLFGAEGQLRFFVLYGDPVVKVAESLPVKRD